MVHQRATRTRAGGPQHLKDDDDPTRRTDDQALRTPTRRPAGAAAWWTSPSSCCGPSSCGGQPGAARALPARASATCWWMSSRTPTPSSTSGSRCWSARRGYPFVVGDDDQCLAAGTQVTMADGAKRRSRRSSPAMWCCRTTAAATLRPRACHRAALRSARQGALVCASPALGQRCSRARPNTRTLPATCSGETPQTYFLYLMHKEGVGYRLGTSQVYTQGQAKPHGRDSSSAPCRSVPTRPGSSARTRARTRRASTRC